jgi:hypothetical protein
MENQTSDTIKPKTNKMPPTALLDLVMYGSNHERAIGAVDQAYEELKQWILERSD